LVIRDLSQQGPCNGGGRYVTAHHHEPAPDGHVLFVTGPEGAVTQVRLTDPTFTLKSSTLHSHSVHGTGPHPRPETSTLLELLTGALTVPCEASVDFAIALDWFNKTVDGATADLTDLADLVHRGKHFYTPLGDVQNLKEVGGAVVDEIAEFVGQHPLLKSVDAIAAPPGHDPNVLSFGSRVAAGVAMRRDIPLVRCTSPREFRDPVRSLAFSARAGALGGQFRCPDNASGQRILIVDDVYASGATVGETARALRAAGASHVASIAAIRTMEFELDHVTKEFAEERLLADSALARTAAPNARPLDPARTPGMPHPDDDDWTF
jgi:adenine/guanine phosphoribosyltransferase-like PRPP-binding protein